MGVRHNMHDISKEYQELGYLSKSGRKSDYVQQDSSSDFGPNSLAKKLPGARMYYPTEFNTIKVKSDPIK
jgi:hypothetical protein